MAKKTLESVISRTALGYAAVLAIMFLPACVETCRVQAREQATPWWQQAQPESVRRWQDMRFGLFIHADEWVQAFELQYYDGQMWKSFHEGTVIGPDWSVKVAPVTAQRFRLNILKAPGGPTIAEFLLF